TDAETLASRRDVLRSAATAAGRDPESILISFAGPAMVFDTEAEHIADLERRAERREMTVADYTAMIDERSVPHGLPDQAHAAMERLASLGVGRYYVQEYASLDDVDIARMERIFTALRG
ncbi:MAG: hypothetical protein ACR2N2_11200, partial [Acidimicrobiia bacterium]